ncbi:uncharacterized protein LOC131019174 [Salvia miltiorrhiza]|uniref:uncharacterized protein LOC131019174 n=1 Tax=Salvia miltiorrhiza TaxID=226208 RepID=UPI0025ACB68A|nr:uncharacterized protein LOC131019174 [Salvia miltiorrhiza]
MACFRLPSRLPSIPLHHQSGHHLILKSSHKLPSEEWECKVCSLKSSGLFYACTKCDFRADIKCASLPAAIYHTAHPQHPLDFLPSERQRDQHNQMFRDLLNHCLLNDPYGERRNQYSTVMKLLQRNYAEIQIYCDAMCGNAAHHYDCYACGSCEFIVHVRCATLLPASTSSRRWDKHHPLLLTHDANLNYPGEFYCDACET